MAAQEIINHSYQDIFTLSIIQFDKACVFSKPEQVEKYSIYWIKKGKGVYNVDFKSFDFHNNILLFLSPGQVFSVETEAIEEAYCLNFVKDFYCIQTHDKEVACNGILFNNIYDTPFVQPNESDTAKLNFILESLIDEFKTDAAAQYDMLQAYLKQFIIQAVRVKKDNYIIKNDVETKLFKAFSVLVEENYRTLHSVTDYAEKLGISPKSLAKHFSKAGTQTPSDFIKNRIILEAKRQAVKRIAYDLGFNDSAYFTRFFTKATTKSPIQFKKDY